MTFADTSCSKALHDVLKERRHQDAKWGGPEHDDGHSEGEWEWFIANRLGSLGYKPYRQRMVEICALALAALESFDRKEGKP